MKKTLLLALYVASITAIPYRLTRLIDQNGKIVNIFWETHINIEQPDPDAPQIGYKEPEPYQAKHYALAENMLQKAIKNLNNRPIKGPVDLIWELNDHKIQHPEETQQSTFLESAGILLYQEAKKQKNINYIVSDNLRGLNNFLAILLFAFECPEENQNTLNYQISNLVNYLDNILEEGNTLLQKAHTKLNSNLFRKLHDYWQSTSKCIANLKKHLKKYDQGKKIRDSVHILSTDTAFIKSWHDCIILRIADFEMLTNILVSNTKYTIMYAGGQHSGDVIYQLVSFGYKKILDIGVSPEGLNPFMKSDIEPILSPAGVRFILQEPRKNYFKLLLEKSVKKFINAFNIKTEPQFIERLTLLEKLRKETYIDFFNMKGKTLVYDKTLLHHAIGNGWNKAAEFLINQPDISIDIKDSLEHTPLHFAIAQENNALVKKLLEKGASQHAKQISGLNALQLAAATNNTTAARLLLEAGTRVDGKDDKSKTAMDYAIMNRNKELVRLLLEYGANPDTARSTHVEEITVMIQEAQQFKKEIHQTIENNGIKQIKTLLSKNYYNSKDLRERTPLHYAIDKKDPETIELLLQKKVTLNAQDAVGRTPLHYAINLKCSKAVQVLVQKGAKLNIQDALGQTPLHYAARNQDKATIKYLLKMTANSNIQDLEGKTPKEYAPQLF